jgi:sialate O-acetylesterase
MVVTTDCDDTLDVHPGNKEPVGKRAALQALALTYAKKSLEFMGPVYQSLSVKGSKAWIQFSHTGKGLHSENGALTDFEIAGKDKKFYPAKADIKKKKYVVVSADAVKQPVYVRLGWRICPQVNLYNEQGLCAASFRTTIEE